MNKSRFLATLLMVFCLLQLHADFTPTAYYVLDGEESSTTDMLNDAQAPLLVTFKANPENLGDEPVSYEWRFQKEGSTSTFLTRYEEETSYEFRESGTTAVSLYVSYPSSDQP